MQRPFRTFIGVDLGGGKGRTTAVARLSLGDDGVCVEEIAARSPARNEHGDSPFYDSELTSYLERHSEAAVVAIDAPLTLTSCVRCQEPVCPGMTACVDPTINWFRGPGRDLLLQGTVANGKPIATPYTQRATEIFLHKVSGILPRETLGQGMGPLTARARYLVRALERRFRLNENLLEVYPKATIHQLFSPELARGYKRDAPAHETRQRILHGLLDLRFGPRTGLQREQCFANDHCFDALICAYTAYLWARDGWSLPTEHTEIFRTDGWIGIRLTEGDRERSLPRAEENAL